MSRVALGCVGVADAASLELLGLRCSRLEYLLLLSHIMWYEIGSHAGKPVPVVSFFPPFALAYNGVWRALWPGSNGPDADNVWFHHCHHVFYTGNYGITPWMDKMLGTIKMPTVGPYGVPKKGEGGKGGGR